MRKNSKGSKFQAKIWSRMQQNFYTDEPAEVNLAKDPYPEIQNLSVEHKLRIETLYKSSNIVQGKGITK